MFNLKYDEKEVVNNIAGDYYNLEKIYQSTFTLEIKPKNVMSSQEIVLSIRVNGETLEYTAKSPKGERHSSFRAQKDVDEIYKVSQDLSHFDDNETFWDEDVTVIIEYDDKKDEMKLK